MIVSRSTLRKALTNPDGDEFKKLLAATAAPDSFNDFLGEVDEANYRALNFEAYNHDSTLSIASFYEAGGSAVVVRCRRNGTHRDRVLFVSPISGKPSQDVMGLRGVDVLTSVTKEHFEDIGQAFAKAALYAGFKKTPYKIRTDWQLRSTNDARLTCHVVNVYSKSGRL